MNRFVLAALCSLMFIVAAVGVGSAAGKIGVVDIAVIMDESVAGQEAHALLGSFVAERQQVVHEKEAELDELVLALDDDAAGLSVERRTALQAQFDEANAELTQLVNQFEAEIEAVIEDFRGQILSDIQIVLQLFGVESEYDVILDMSSIAFASDAVDVTRDVIKKYDELLAESRTSAEE